MANKKEEHKVLAEQLIERVGGEENIANVINCVTRLRFYLKDEAVPNDQEIESLKGVLGVARGSGQYQVIVGQAVDDIYKEVEALLSLSEDRDVHTDERREDESALDKVKRAG